MLLTIKELSQRIGVNIATLRKWTDIERIPSTKTAGGHRRYDLNSVLIALNKTDISHKPITIIYTLTDNIDSTETCQREAEMYCIENKYKYIVINDVALNFIGNCSSAKDNRFEEILRLVLANRAKQVIAKSDLFLSATKFNFLKIICEIKNIEFINLVDNGRKTSFNEEVPKVLELLRQAIREKNTQIIDYDVEEKIEKIERALNDY